jgi:hypothetical protein
MVVLNPSLFFFFLKTCMKKKYKASVSKHVLPLEKIASGSPDEAEGRTFLYEKKKHFFTFIVSNPNFVQKF